MPVPCFGGKHDVPSVFTPEDAFGATDERPDLPPAVVLCPQDALFDHAVETRAVGEPIGCPGEERVCRVSDEVGVVGEFGVGAPVTAALVDEAAACGAETVCLVGGAGCLDPSIQPDEAILATRAVRDEGVSHHYLSPAVPAEPTPELVERLARSIERDGVSVERGPTWTTDAFYRETAPEVEHYAAAGVRSVEMEAAALFAVAAYRGLDAAAVFAVGDYVTPTERDVPAASNALLPDLVGPTVDALRSHVR